MAITKAANPIKSTISKAFWKRAQNQVDLLNRRRPQSDQINDFYMGLAKMQIAIDEKNKGDFVGMLRQLMNRKA